MSNPKIICIIPKNHYGCQLCKKDFISLKEEPIEQGIHPVCSSRCNFMIIYNFIKKMGFNDESLKFMQKKVRGTQKLGEFKRQQAIFDITKHYVKKGLSSIDLMREGDRDKIETDKKVDNETKGQENPPYGIGGFVPCLVSSIKKERLSKWF